MSDLSPVPLERIDGAILLVRGQKVLLDFDLADMYGVETKILNKAVRRNIERFPADFLFQLTNEEFDTIKYRFEIGIPKKGGRRYMPYVFTEQGIAMLSSVLSSPRAIAVNIEIMRSFVRLRQLISTSADLARKLAALERKYDAQFKVVFDAIRELMSPVTPADKKREIGYHATMKPSPSPKSAAASKKKTTATRRAA